MKRLKRLLVIVLSVAMLASISGIEAFAASYPLVIVTTKSSETIPEGEVGLIQLMISPEYNNEQYHVMVYNSSGRLVASAEKTYYNVSSGLKYVDISVDTAKLDLPVGTYTVKYWMSFYSFMSWHDAPNKYETQFKVIKNTCKGNHNMVVSLVFSEGTCSKAGSVKLRCTKCGHMKVEDRYGDHTYGSWSKLNDSTHQHTCTVCGKSETASHSWNAGAVTKQPTCAATGVKTYTCKTCNGTKTESIAKTNNHSYGSWTKVNDTTHQRACTLCGKTESANHSYDAGVVTKQPTCAATGVKTYTCKTCGGTKTETLAKTSNHTYAKGTKVDDDRHKHSCTTCGKEETVAHVWDAGTITLAPTLETTGLREHSCKDCDATKTVVVPKRANGDLNGDQNIDNKDVEYLLWHTLFPGSYPLELFADFNFDGSIDNKDVEYLLWHTLFPDSYPLEAK